MSERASKRLHFTELCGAASRERRHAEPDRAIASGDHVFAFRHGELCLAESGSEDLLLAWADVHHAAVHPPILLGWHQQQPIFAADISERCDLPSVALRGALAQCSDAELSWLITARAVLNWRSSYRFCPACGHALGEPRAEWALRCRNPDCGRSHFARIAPAVIVAVTHQNKLLLGRQPAWYAGLYSVLAGFVEPGESLEDAVRREVFEEAGAELSSVRYVSSQAWPFPCSLMLGYQAEASHDRICTVDDELEHAAWFSRDELRAAQQGRGDIKLPQYGSISRGLIDDFVAAE